MAEIVPQTDASATPDPFAFKDQYTVEQDAALQLCVRDADRAEAWVNSHFLTVRWIEADMLYQSPPVLKVWEGTNVPRANISLFTVATHVNTILAKLTGGLFYEKPPFILRPRPEMSENTTRAITAVEEFQLDELKFKRECKRGLFSTLLLGTGIWKDGWKQYECMRKQFKRKAQPKDVQVLGKKITLRSKESDQFDVIEKTETVSRPCFESLDIRDCLVDPACRTSDIRDAKYVIHKRTVTFKDLMELAPQLGYELPSEEEVRSWFMPPSAANTSQGDRPIDYPGSSAYLQHAAPLFQKTTDDPLEEPLELLERWDDNKLIVVLARARILYNGQNILGRKPFYSVNWWNCLDAFWGMGLGVLLAGDQRYQQGLANASADLCSLIVNPTVVRSRGSNVTSQNIRQRLGGIVDVDGDVDKAFKWAEVPTIPAEIFAQAQASEARAEAVSGANELLTQGNLPTRGRTSLGRTATGAAAMAGAANERIGSFVEDFVDQVFEPFLWNLHQMNCEFLPLDTMRQILNDKLGKDFELSEEDYFNAPIERFEILAGSHMAVKQQMSQAVTLMVELFQSPQTMQELAQINGQYVDVEELLHMIADVSGFRNFYDIIKPLTPEMQQQMQQSSPQAQKAQADQQKMAQQHDNAQELNDQKAINRMVERGLAPAIEQSVRAEAEGQPPGA